MVLRQAARPRIRCKILQWLGLANANERVAHSGFDQVERAQSNLAICLDSIPHVLAELRLKYRVVYDAWPIRRHRSPVIREAVRSIVACVFLPERDAGSSATAVRSSVSAVDEPFRASWPTRMLARVPHRRLPCG